MLKKKFQIRISQSLLSLRHTLQDMQKMFRQCKCAPLPVGVLSGLAKYALRSVSQPQPGFCASIWDLVKISYYGVLKKNHSDVEERILSVQD